MNAGYYKLTRYAGMKCHNDLSLFFQRKLVKWSYTAARKVGELYDAQKDGFYITFGRKKYRVVKNDFRTRIVIRHAGEEDRLSAQCDQIIENSCKKYILDFKFTKLPKESADEIVFDARQQIAYYAWIVNDPDIVGGAVIVASLDTNEVIATDMFKFSAHEKERALIRRLNELPGYEGVKYDDIER